MLKFFRKYNKVILVVGGSILMVLFLLPAGIGQMLGAGGNMTVATMDGRKVSILELNRAGGDLQLVTELAPTLIQVLGMDPKDSERWFLLAESAKRAGLVGGPGDGREFLTAFTETVYQWQLFLANRANNFEYANQLRSNGELFKQNYRNETENKREQIINLRGDADHIDRVLAQAHGIFRMLELNNTASLYSTRTAVSLGKRLSDTAIIGFASIPAGTVSIDLQPTQEELQTHFDEYKAVDRATDPNEIGYLMPAMVEVEWLAISRASIESRLSLDPIEVNRYWRQNRDQFPGEFAESQPAVELAYRKIRGNAVFASANEIIRRQLHTSTASFPLENKYKQLPANWDTRKPDLTVLAAEVEAAIVKEFKLGPGSDAVTRGGPMPKMTFQSLELVAGIGQSSMLIGDALSVSFAQYAMNMQELDGDSRVSAQKGMTYGPLSNTEGNQYYFRVNSVRASGPPDSIDSVLTQVRPDYMILQGMLRLEENAEDYRRQAVAGGLASLARGLGVEYVVDVEVSSSTVRKPLTQEIYNRLDVPAFRDAVLEAARKLDPLVPISDIPLDQRIITVPVGSAKSLIVVEISRYNPLTIERFRQIAAPIRSLANSTEAAADAFAAFTIEALRKRLKFEAIGNNDEEPAPEVPAESEPAPVS